MVWWILLTVGLILLFALVHFLNGKDIGNPPWRRSLPHVLVATLSSFLAGYHLGYVPNIRNSYSSFLFLLDDMFWKSKKYILFCCFLMQSDQWDSRRHLSRPWLQWGHLGWRYLMQSIFLLYASVKKRLPCMFSFFNEGLVVSTCLGGAFAGSLFSGWIVDGVGCRRAFQFCALPMIIGASMR